MKKTSSSPELSEVSDPVLNLLVRTGLLDQAEEMRALCLVLDGDPKDERILALALLGVTMLKCGVPRAAVTKALLTFKPLPMTGGCFVIILEGAVMVVQASLGPMLVCRLDNLEPIDPSTASPDPLTSTVFSLDRALSITRGD